MKCDTEEETFEYEVRVQFFLEIYGEELRDLLRDTNLSLNLERAQNLAPNLSSTLGRAPKLLIRDGRGENSEPQLIGALEQRIFSADESMKCVNDALNRCVVDATAMNA